MSLFFQSVRGCAAGLILAGIAAGCSHSQAQPHVTQKVPAGDREDFAPTVQTVSPARQALLIRFDQPGVVEASESADLYSRASGYVRAVHADIGQTVRAGDVLLEVDVPELEQDLAFKEALVAESRAALAVSKAGVAAARGALEAHTSQVALAQADLRKAESDCEFRRREHGRYSELAAKNASTAQLLDERKLVLGAAESACASAHAKLKAVENDKIVLAAKLASAEADVQKAAAHVAVAEADRDRTRTMFEYAQLKAPFDGIVTRRTVDSGEYVASPGSDRANPLFTLERIDTVTLVLRVPEKEVPAIHPGISSTVRFDGLRSRDITGKVTRMSKSLDSKSRTMRVEIDLPNTDGTIYPGMYGTVAVVLADLQDALTVPAAALFSDGGELYVFEVDHDRVVRTEVHTGYDDGRIVQIVDGLDGDEQVIVSNKGELTDGEHVHAAAVPVESKVQAAEAAEPGAGPHGAE